MNRPLPKPVRLPSRDPLEKEIEKTVCDYAKRKGIYSRKYTTQNYRASPDRIFIIGPPATVFFIEFKRLGAKLTDSQAREKTRLEQYGISVYACDNVDDGIRIVDMELRDHARRLHPLHIDRSQP